MAGCAPHFLFETSKRKCAAPGGKEKMFGGSVCAGADLLPPAGDGWRSRAAVRDGNALPLGKPPARRGLGYILRRFSLPLSWQFGEARRSACRGGYQPPAACGPGGHRHADQGSSSVIKNNFPALGTAGGGDIRRRNEWAVLLAQMLCIPGQVRRSGFPGLRQPIDPIVALQSAALHFRAAERTIQTNLLLFRYPQERGPGKPRVFPVLSPATKEDISIIFGRTCACRKFPDPGALGAVHQ